MPPMLDRARLRPGRGFSPTRAAFYFSQRFVTGAAPRRVVSRVIAAGINLRHRTGAGRVSAAPRGENEESEIIASLTRDGYAMLRPLLTDAMVAEIEAFLRVQEAVGSAGRRFRVDDRPPGANMASYSVKTILECPHVLALANDPAVLQIASDYLGCKPTLSSIGLRWSFPNPGETEETQRFHRDPDDWRFLKLFVYLTDVDTESGPHVYVAGSHRTAGSIRERLYTTEEIDRRHGRESVRTIGGPRGTSFLADTYGIHRGAVPTRRPRLILQLQYSLLPVFAFVYQPVPVASKLGLDRYVNRLLVA